MAKIQFESMMEARQYIEERHLDNYNAYQCRVCGKNHIGNNR